MSKAPNKTAVVRLRCTPEDQARWVELADEAGLSISELMRQSIGRARAYTPEEREHKRQVLHSLARIGNNLNQIARWANMHGPAAEAVQVVAHLIALQDLVRELAEQQDRQRLAAVGADVGEGG